jgi:hypothetical protein
MTETQTFEDKCRYAARHLYVKMHAPGILAALMNSSEYSSSTLVELRMTAIEQAGLLFDELEPK